MRVAPKALGDAVLDRVERRLDPVFDEPDLDAHIPLDREILMGDGLADGCDLSEHSLLVCRLNRQDIFGDEERVHHRERRRQRNLEPRVRRKVAL